MADRAHWNDRYRTIGAERVSWYQERPAVSLELLAALGVTASDAVIDVGGGASTLVDHLLAAGHEDVAVLDLSAEALAVARARLARPERVDWIEADLLAWEPPRQWDVWHDRAVLHFLVTDTDPAAYVQKLRGSVRPGGAFVIGVFAEDGPRECSALPVRRHRADDLVELLGDIEVVEQRRELHRTPGDIDQPFRWLAGRLRP